MIVRSSLFTCLISDGLTEDSIASAERVLRHHASMLRTIYIKFGKI